MSPFLRMHFGFQRNPLSVIQNRSGMQNNFPSNFLLPPRLTCTNQFCLLLFTGRLRKWRNAISAHQKKWVMGSGFWKSCHAAPKHTSCNLLLAGLPLAKRRQLRNNFVAIPQKSCTGVPPLQKKCDRELMSVPTGISLPNKSNIILEASPPLLPLPSKVGSFLCTHTQAQWTQGRFSPPFRRRRRSTQEHDPTQEKKEEEEKMPKSGFV